MNEIGILGLSIGLVLVVIIITKTIWQWILGTNILIEESRKQTQLLERLVSMKKESSMGTATLSKEEKARLVDEKLRK